MVCCCCRSRRRRRRRFLSLVLSQSRAYYFSSFSYGNPLNCFVSLRVYLCSVTPVYFDFSRKSVHLHFVQDSRFLLGINTIAIIRTSFLSFNIFFVRFTSINVFDIVFLFYRLINFQSFQLFMWMCVFAIGDFSVVCKPTVSVNFCSCTNFLNSIELSNFICIALKNGNDVTTLILFTICFKFVCSLLRFEFLFVSHGNVSQANLSTRCIRVSFHCS